MCIRDSEWYKQLFGESEGKDNKGLFPASCIFSTDLHSICLLYTSNELENGPKIYFCGNSISPTYLNNIISLCKGKRFSINVISKSRW